MSFILVDQFSIGFAFDQIQSEIRPHSELIFLLLAHKFTSRLQLRGYVGAQSINHTGMSKETVALIHCIINLSCHIRLKLLTLLKETLSIFITNLMLNKSSDQL